MRKTIERAAEAANTRAAKNENGAAKAVSTAVANAVKREDARRNATLGVYSWKIEKSPFGVPFVAASDALALQAAKEILPLVNVYKVGDFCLLDGKIRSCRPFVVLDNRIKE